ncbi:hypothetical protein BS47DRAFT_1402897 [Hydnum rufescens UP504]|uniref:C2H2-type domain-containing protein n=1 Tax=Hydnum rufescens UP504 TaxID=1448309 RepID=A0A9P6DFQ8_9AGAM|nr:hypothetical protein BS47DRAFT_1402897 [Hydnum rufescens UP504]
MVFTTKVQYGHHLKTHQETTEVPTIGTIHKQADGFHCPECSYISRNVGNFRRHIHISSLIKAARGHAKAGAAVSDHSTSHHSLKRPHSPSVPEPQPSRPRLHSPEREVIDVEMEAAHPDVAEVESDGGSEYNPDYVQEAQPHGPAIHQSHDLIRPPALAALQLGIDPEHHLVICEGHGYAVPRKDLASHFQRSPEHKGQHLPQDIEDILDANNVPEAVTRPTHLTAPIQSIPCQSGFHCITCNYATLQLNTLRNHLSKEHPGHQARDLIKTCTVQVVFGQSHLERIWAVEPYYSTIAADNHDSVQFVEHLKAMEEELEVVDVIQAPRDPRHTSLFLRRFQWLEATDGLPFRQLHGLAAKPVKKENEFVGLEQRVEGYFSKLKPVLMGMQSLVLRWINTPDEKVGINHRPFAYPQMESSTDKYQAWGLRLLCFVLRHVSSDEPILSVLLTGGQITHARAVLTALSAHQPPSDVAFDSLIHSLFDSLFFSQHREVSRHATQCPVQSFVMCSAIDKSSGNFEKCGTLVGRLSALFHVIRLVAVKSIAKKAEELDETVENPEFEVCQPFCQRWLRQSQPSPFEALQSLDHYATTVAYSERHLPVFQWDAKHKSFSIKGHTVALSKMGDMYTAMLQQAEEQIKELTGGIETHVPAHKDIVDDMTEAEPGYCFASPHNHNIQSLRYLNLLAKDNSEWVHSRMDGGGHVKAVACKGVETELDGKVATLKEILDPSTTDDQLAGEGPPAQGDLGAIVAHLEAAFEQSVVKKLIPQLVNFYKQQDVRMILWD